MDRESQILLQKIDCNCNDCIFMARDIPKRRSFDGLYEGYERSARRHHYGKCSRLIKDLEFIANICMPENQECFIHRRDFKKI